MQAPFCVHPKTGKVCIPINVERSHEFNPDDVPTLSEMVRDLNGDRSKVWELICYQFSMSVAHCLPWESWLEWLHSAIRHTSLCVGYLVTV